MLIENFFLRTNVLIKTVKQKLFMDLNSEPKRRNENVLSEKMLST